MTLGEKIAASALLLTFGWWPPLIVYGMLHPHPKQMSPQEQALASCGLRETEIEVYGSRVAEQALRPQLRSPSTASFIPESEMRYKLVNGCTVELVGWVDAQNGFGATTRSNWIAHIYGSGSAMKASDATILE